MNIEQCCRPCFWLTFALLLGIGSALSLESASFLAQWLNELASPVATLVGAVKSSIPIVAAITGNNSFASKSGPEIIAYWGYPVEVHTVWTADGYRLTMHRIPYGRNQSGAAQNAPPRPVVFFQHGLLGASDNWHLTLPNQSAPFVFADAGLDVWMGNVRGNRYSTFLNDKPVGYWTFSFDEHAAYDLPAMVDYVLNATNAPNLHYVGHSQGTLMMFLRLATDQTFAQKIANHFALAPIGGSYGWQGLFKNLDLIPDDRASVELGKDLELFANTNSVQSILFGSLCGTGLVAQLLGNSLCNFVLYSISGANSQQINNSVLGDYFAHEPAGTSGLNMLHWRQMMAEPGVSTMNFFNGTPVTKYNYSLVNAPTHLYVGGNDFLADAVDVSYITTNVPAQYLVSVKQLPLYNHADFLLGWNATRDVYCDVLAKIVNNPGLSCP